jgi:hypothetical protein
MRFRFCFVATLSLLCSMASPSSAELKLNGEGKTQTLVRDQFPPKVAAQYDLFQARCTQCHAMSRPISALTTGVTPISRGSFEADGIKEYVVKMMRKPRSGVSREDAKEILQFLQYARELAKKPG